MNDKLKHFNQGCELKCATLRGQTAVCQSVIFVISCRIVLKLIANVSGSCYCNMMEFSFCQITHGVNCRPSE